VRIDVGRGKTYLTTMNAPQKFDALTKVSAKGQIVVPKALREQLGWEHGAKLEIVRNGNSLVLRRPLTAGTIPVDEALVQLREIAAKYKGPPLSTEDLSWSAEVDRKTRKDD